MREPDNDVTQAVASLRATRRFSDAAVGHDEMHVLLEAARWTGSARNGQPWRFIVIRNPAVRNELSMLGSYAAHLAGAPVVVALAVNEDAGGQDALFDAGRAAQNLMLAAGAVGLGSCPASFFPSSSADRASQLCRMSAPWRVRTAISLGYPGPKPEGTSAIPTGRLPLSQLVTEIE